MQCNYMRNTVTAVDTGQWTGININTITSCAEGLLLEGVGVKHYSCSKYFVYNLCENRCRIHTFHLMDSDYEEKQDYFPPPSLYLVSTL